MLKEFLESKENAHDFLETVMSSAVSQVTDAPPETRIKKPESEVDNFSI